MNSPLVVMKFGGTSVGNIDRIRAVSHKIKKEIEKGYRVAVVVSAMSGVTNKMVEYCHALDEQASFEEYDAVVSSGEQVTSGLLAIALNKIGAPAQSFQGWQVALHAIGDHARASIDYVDSHLILETISKGIIPIMAGFQGISPNGRIMTLGRGGSDTSAVALAAAIGADRCDIYTDVDGVYSTDPRIVKHAQKIDRITYEEMLELASGGAKVLQTRSVALAMREKIPVRVLSSFNENDETSGTFVTDEDKNLEKKLVTGIAYSTNEAKITVRGLPDQAGVASSIFAAMAENGVNVDMIVQSIGNDGMTNITFTVERFQLDAATTILEEFRKDLAYKEVITSEKVVKISIVGAGMTGSTGVAATMFRTLAEHGINIQVISTSEIKISVLIDANYTELAMRVLHSAYGLDSPMEKISE